MTAYEDNIDLSDDKLLSLMQKAGQYQAIPCLMNHYYESREEDVAPVTKELPAEHLIATYWG